MKFALTLITIASVSFPAFAEEMDPTKLTCGEFMAMDMDGMMHAVESMQMAGEGAMAEGEAMSPEDANKMTMEHCQGHDEMMAMEAMMMK
jgi:hypothetical protein